jgi:hypothetical protein
MSFIHPFGPEGLRKKISYALIGIGLFIWLFPAVVGLTCIALGIVLFSPATTDALIKKVLHFLKNIRH